MAKEDPIARIEREQAEKKNKSNVAKIIAIVLGVILVIVTIQDITMVKELNTDKKELTERITALQKEYDELSSDYDFINSQLDSSREEVAVLVDRIKKTEATNRAKMRQYEKELGTLRSIMKSYLVQIDSLNNANLKLSNDLAASRQALAEAKGENKDLTQKVETLNSKVATGSVVKARAISVQAYNSSDKVTDRSSRVTSLMVSLSLVENDLAKKGEMALYVRALDPEGVLITDGTNAAFFLNKEKTLASASRVVDYEGAEVDVNIYINDVPGYVKGLYTVDVYSEQGKLGSAEIMLR